MEPTFSEGDRVLIRRGQRPQAGDVVVLRTAAARSTAAARPSCVIKRVAAVAGEVVPPSIGPAGDRVPAGRLVLLGDNRSASFDSRQVGYFRIDDLLGTVVRRLGSPSAPPRRNARKTSGPRSSGMMPTRSTSVGSSRCPGVPAPLPGTTSPVRGPVQPVPVDGDRTERVSRQLPLRQW
ncbi:S26 family signal peptidase [Micromonospora sp. NPDC049102]|uniref:S26 family signal peptidase n=1 Tax=Micromonospora sp. NPDC049102 TaxID=3364265 RepID=UPI003711274A